MESNINNLISNIYSLVNTKGWLHDHLADDLARSISLRLQAQFSERKQKASLRLSQMGPKCPCALWYSINRPELAEALPPWAEVKFSYGHILEAYAIALAKAAGHLVEGEQDHVELDGISGHRDCVIDGYIVDIKSAASRSFIKFKDGSIRQSDTFGYLDQLDSYIIGSRDTVLITHKTIGYLLAVDKQRGHMYLYKHEVTDEREKRLRERIATYKHIVSRKEPPACECGTTPHQSSGNVQLDVKAGYSAYKYCCNPSLRTFLYASGPVYLTKVVRTPNTPEVDRYGNLISQSLPVVWQVAGSDALH